MGRHRGRDLRRGISPALLWSALVVVLVVTAGVLWAALGDRADKQADQAAKTCTEGPAQVAVAADPALVDGLKALAQQYNDTHPVVRDKCITVEVAPKDPAAVLDALKNGWDPAAMGPMPALWIPESSVWTSQLTAANPAMVSGQARSLVTSPVGLAVAGDAKDKLDGKFSWSDIPALQQEDNSLRSHGLDDWGSLRLAMPTGPQSDATFLAAQAIASAVSKADPLTAQAAASEAVKRALADSLDGAPRTTDGGPLSGLAALNTPTPAKAPLHAVPVTEQQFYATLKAQPTLNISLIYPTGKAPVADFPAAALAGNGLTGAQTGGADEFLTFISSDGRLKALEAGGFRVYGNAPTGLGSVSFVSPDVLQKPDQDAQNAVTTAVTAAR
ncbi:hypothetical protein [Jongsikchunia kroppenstedtii]|uniref:hypothetical protein n=1 Tax=Jongsikchunia kroppenstedtii TaxID=1121721 RepID=UPI000382B4AD|nr:hypothetical protein [Jongsikchunia kroppenstedtii]